MNDIIIENIQFFKNRGEHLCELDNYKRRWEEAGYKIAKSELVPPHKSVKLTIYEQLNILDSEEHF